MKYKNLLQHEKCIIKAIPIIFLIGSFMHFLYDISGKSKFIGLIAPINESVWEHMKMVPLPMIGFWIIYYIVNCKKYSIDKNKWFTSCLVSLIVAIISIPLLYYFYTQAFGVELLWVDILIFFISIVFGQLAGLYYYKYGNGINSNIVILVLIIILLLFMIFTYYPPNIPIFQTQ